MNNIKFNEIYGSLQRNKDTAYDRLLSLVHRQVSNSNLKKAVLYDPLSPPQKMMNGSTSSINIPIVPGVPINIETRGGPSGYQQVGVLVERDNNPNTTHNSRNGRPPLSEHRASGDLRPNGKLLPLYGQQTYRGSRQWNYYTSSDGYQAVKLPVIHKNRNCQDGYGCEEIYDNAHIRVRGYGATKFKVNLYENRAPRYIPYV
tara:strand:- start:500 stop:1105 length:606 start_codon:yes stop_codon:yes gene_type:complete